MRDCGSSTSKLLTFAPNQEDGNLGSGEAQLGWTGGPAEVVEVARNATKTIISRGRTQPCVRSFRLRSARVCTTRAAARARRRRPHTHARRTTTDSACMPHKPSVKFSILSSAAGSAQIEVSSQSGDCSVGDEFQSTHLRLTRLVNSELTTSCMHWVHCRWVL